MTQLFFIALLIHKSFLMKFIICKIINFVLMDQVQKVVVTGGAGFVGSHLVEELAKNPKLQVYSLDDYSSGKIQNHVKNVNYVNGHTKNIDSLITFVPSIIYHLGQYSRTSASFNNPEFVWDQNCHGTFKVVEFCRKNKVRLLYAASSTKMADNGQGRNQSPYSWSKATNVDLINRYGEWFGLNHVIVYFYNVYGGREVRQGEYATLIAIWKQCIKKNQKLPIVSPGTQVRTFTFVEDIVQGIIEAGKNGKGDGYPLGAEQSFSLWEVGQLFGKTKPEQFDLLPPRPGDRKSTFIDLGRTKQDLKWSAKTKLGEHIQNFLKQQRQLNKNN